MLSQKGKQVLYSETIVDCDDDQWKSQCEYIAMTDNLVLHIEAAILNLTSSRWPSLCDAIAQNPNIRIFLALDEIKDLKEFYWELLLNTIKTKSNLNFIFGDIDDRATQVVGLAKKSKKWVLNMFRNKNTNLIQTSFFQDLLEAIQQGQQLTLMLGKCQVIDKSFLEQLCPAIKKNTDFTFDLSFSRFSNVTDTSWDALCALIRTSNRLKIDLSCTSLEELPIVQWRQLCDAIKHSQHLSIKMKGNSLYKLDDPSWKLLMDALTYATHLSVDLGSNDLGTLKDKHWQELCQIISKGNITIGLSRNQLLAYDSKNWKLLCKALEESRNLTIDLANNYLIYNSNFELLLDAIKDNPTLVINLQGSNLTADEVNRLVKLFMSGVLVITGDPGVDLAIRNNVQKRNYAILSGLAAKQIPNDIVKLIADFTGFMPTAEGIQRARIKEAQFCESEIAEFTELHFSKEANKTKFLTKVKLNLVKSQFEGYEKVIADTYAELVHEEIKNISNDNQGNFIYKLTSAFLKCFPDLRFEILTDSIFSYSQQIVKEFQFVRQLAKDHAVEDNSRLFADFIDWIIEHLKTNSTSHAIAKTKLQIAAGFYCSTLPGHLIGYFKRYIQTLKLSGTDQDNEVILDYLREAEKFVKAKGELIDIIVSEIQSTNEPLKMKVLTARKTRVMSVNSWDDLQEAAIKISQDKIYLRTPWTANLFGMPLLKTKLDNYLAKNFATTNMLKRSGLGG